MRHVIHQWLRLAVMSGVKYGHGAQMYSKYCHLTLSVSVTEEAQCGSVSWPKVVKSISNRDLVCPVC